MTVDYCGMLREFVATKDFIGPLDSMRCEGVRRCLTGSEFVLPDPLLQLCGWLNQNWAEIDSAIVWGSFLRGTERRASFSFLHDQDGQFNDLVCGPSDVDGLVVVKAPITVPELWEDYISLDRVLRQSGKRRLNVFRDLILLPIDTVREEFETRRDTFLSYHCYAYKIGGCLLKISAETAQLLEYFSRSFDFESHFTERVEAKRRLLVSYLNNCGDEAHV